MELGEVEEGNCQSTAVRVQAGYELRILSSIRLIGGFGSARVQVHRLSTVVPREIKASTRAFAVV